MSNGLLIEPGDYGPRGTAKSPWTDAMTRRALANGVVELRLSRVRDVEFLADIPQLLALTISEHTLDSVEPIHRLPNLRALSVYTYCKTEIRFSAFPHLEKCSLEWRPRATSLFDCVTLRYLFVRGYDGHDLAQFGRLANLETLILVTAPARDLEGLRPLAKLRDLQIGYMTKLASLSGLESLTNLEKLEIQTCRRIAAIDQVALLPRLRWLSLDNDGPIASLKPLDRLTGLELVGFPESTDILDGDLSPLLRQNHLDFSRVAFQNRRHYSHRREDIWALARHGEDR